jgi:hypothetical protein
MIVVGMGTKSEGVIEVDQDGVESFSRECSAEMVITSARSGFNVRESFEMMVRKIMKVQRGRQTGKPPISGISTKAVPSKKECTNSKIGKGGKW